MGHAGAADGLHQRFLDDAVFHVQAQLARALLRRAPAHTVGVTGDVFDSLRLDPLALFRDGRGAVIRALGDADHVFHFFGILHFGFPLILGKLVDRAYKSHRFIIAHPPCKKEHFSRIFSQGVKKRLLPARLLPA